MGKLTASLVVSVDNRTAAGARGVKKTLADIRRVEGGIEASRRSHQEIMEQRRRRAGIFFGGMTMAATAAGYAAAKTYASFADVERRMARIGITADATSDDITSAFTTLQQQAQKVAMPVEKAMAALDTLVASGMNLKDAMSFLPSVLATAQASGSETQDIANTALKASSALKISAEQMQAAFDMMLTGTKAGQFELPDMSQYLPELANSYASLGYEGLEGLRELIAVLQTLREDTGSASAAATQAQNIFGKMYSEETAKRFKKFGKDLRSEMAAAKKNGESTIGAFIRLSKEAVKGDMSKLPLLFSDQEFRLGMQSLMTSGDSLARFFRSMDGLKVKDAVFNDLNRILEGSQAKIDKFKGTWDSLMTKIGGNVAGGVNPVLDGINEHMDRTAAYAEGLRKTGADDPQTKRAYEQAYAKQWRSMYPDKGPDGWKRDFYQDMMSVGRGLEGNFLDRLMRIQRATELYLSGKPARSSTMDADGNRTGITSRTPPGGEFPGGDRHLDPMNLPEHDVPLPSWVTAEADAAKQQLDEISRKIMKYSRKVDPALAEEESNRRHRNATMRAAGAYPDPENDPTPEEDAAFMQRLKRFFFGKATDPNFDPRQHFIGRPRPVGTGEPGILDDLDRSKPLDVSAAGPREVTLTGTPSVTLSGTPTVISQPSGVQQVQVTNQQPVHAPINVSVTVNATTNADPEAIGRQVADQIGQRVKSEMAGIYVNRGWEVA